MRTRGSTNDDIVNVARVSRLDLDADDFILRSK
jgi:hypothetical protein